MSFTSRRQFMASLGGAALAILSGRIAFARPIARVHGETALAQLLASPSALVLGEACLTLPECEQAARRLAVDGNALRDGELAQRIRDDFARGAVVNVDGWILSRTEAAVYALATLIHSGKLHQR